MRGRGGIKNCIFGLDGKGFYRPARTNKEGGVNCDKLLNKVLSRFDEWECMARGFLNDTDPIYLFFLFGKLESANDATYQEVA
jgi:hypothetical protein